MVLALAMAWAHGFCGTYVGGTTDELYNRASEVAIVKQGSRTTLTFKNAYEGDAAAFTLLVPVPEILHESDVRVADDDLLLRLREYAEPRQVSYSCATIGVDSDNDGSDDGVDVHEQFLVVAPTTGSTSTSSSWSAATRSSS